MKISNITCPGCKGNEFEAGDKTYICKSCGYSLTDDDKDKILKGIYEQHKAQRANRRTDWKIGKNASGTPWCTRSLGKVFMVIFKGINGEPCNLKISGNPFIKKDKFTLSNYDFETASKEADEIYRSEIRNAIISLNEQLSFLSKMKYFEFNDYPYFALICAETEDEAIKCYLDEVCDITEEDDGPPNEITEDEARIKYLSHSKSEHEQKLSKGEFEEYISDSKPCILLIDSCLV